MNDECARITVSFQPAIEITLTPCVVMLDRSCDFPDRNDRLLPKIEEISEEDF